MGKLLLLRKIEWFLMIWVSMYVYIKYEWNKCRAWGANLFNAKELYIRLWYDMIGSTEVDLD